MGKNTIVYIVHAIDTEGPLYENLQAKFSRLEELFGLNHIPPTRENLEKLKFKQIDLGGIEEDVARILNGHLAEYNDSWEKIDSMLDRIMDDDFRKSRPDSYGGGWVYNWHCLDHVGFINNPRRRDMGYHNIFDHYVDILKQKQDTYDSVEWHFHPMSTYNDAHQCATSFVNSPELYQILCRKVIERNWFPSVFRAGFQVERPDSNWFLEQWIPFDISNMSIDDNSELDKTVDFRNGRSGDWRRAPSDWSIYKPSHDDYQIPGNCRRWIGRALNVLNRIASIDQREMDKAFHRADSGLPTLVGFATHDFRNLGTEVEFIRDLIDGSLKKYSKVKYKFCTGVEAFRSIIWPDGIDDEPLDFDLIFHPQSSSDVAYVEVKVTKGKVFGPQPFLSIKTQSRRFIHDNFDFDMKDGRWFYAFHSDTLPLNDVAHIGVAANDKYGNTYIRHLININGSLKEPGAGFRFG